MGAAHRRGRHRKARVAEQPHAIGHDRGRRRRLRDGRKADRSQRGRPVLRSVAPSITAAVALAGASVIAVDPGASASPEIATTSAEVRLAADSSVLFIPINLAQDIINIPYNEVQSIGLLGDTLLFQRDDTVATNAWGTDPADIGKYYWVANTFIPLPAFSNALGAQLAGLAEVLLPMNSGCGITCNDPQALLAGWFQINRIVELLTTGQYTFDTTPVTEPDGTTHPPEGVWSFAGPVTWGGDFNHPEWNTKTDPVTGQPVVPWAGTTFVLDPLSPFTNYLAHLMSDPTSDGNAIKFPTVEEAATNLQKIGEGVNKVWNIVLYSLSVIIGAVLPGTTLPDTILPATTTDSLALNSAPVGADAVTNLESSGGDRRGEDGEDQAGRQNVGIHSILKRPITGLGVAQITNAAATDDTGTSTDALDREKAPPVTKDGTKFEPRRPSSDAGHRDGLAGAVNAGLGQLRSSLSPKKPSGAASDGSEAGESGASGG
jgi:hypothetical protein